MTLDAHHEHPLPPKPPPPRTVPADVAARFERLPLSRWHVTVRLIVGVVTFFEAFDQLLIAYALPQLRQEWHLGTAHSTALLTVGSVGMLVGAVVSGRLADRYGRVRVIAACIGVSGACNLLLTLCTAPEPFMAARFVQGLAIGGEVPVAATFIAEITRSHRRGRFVLLYELVFPAGLTVGALLAAWLVPVLGWRWMFGIAALPGLLCLLVRHRVPESPRWLADHGRHGEALRVMARIEAEVEKATGSPLPPPDGPHPVTAPARDGDRRGDDHRRRDGDGDVRGDGRTRDSANRARGGGPTGGRDRARGGLRELLSGPYRRRTVVIGTLWFAGYFVNYGITSWLPTIYETRYHLPLSDALLYSTVTSCAGLLGCALVALTVDVVGRRRTVTGCLGLAAAALLALGLFGGDSPVHVLVWTSLAAVFFFGSNICLYLYTPELFPTRMRALGSSVGGALNRVGVISGPIVVGAVYAGGRLGAVFLGLAAVAAVGALTAGLGAEETAGRRLEDIAP
ncbi:MFS transporter [Streptomyces reniochalinae]|uniref:MFS transporter n=1 Tax=Streptomyces reniochalinae TaxID=2250578 RepID=A0A367ERG1_9ACTN|nr:MFS transporter [Streptomyces reniochalinae]RCG20302.1 MFS transporter [Streptomyces reniochalinae]